MGSVISLVRGSFDSRQEPIGLAPSLSDAAAERAVTRPARDQECRTTRAVTRRGAGAGLEELPGNSPRRGMCRNAMGVHQSGWTVIKWPCLRERAARVK